MDAPGAGVPALGSCLKRSSRCKGSCVLQVLRLALADWAVMVDFQEGHLKYIVHLVPTLEQWIQSLR